jgi:hypothetical protein
MKISRSRLVKAAAAAGVALAALGTATVAQAGGNVFFSVGAQVAPGISVGVSTAPYYAAPAYYPQPVYVQPAPVYYQPAPVYYQPAPVYVAPPVYGVTYVRPWGGGYHRHGRHWR